MFSKRRGQSTLEYAVVLAVVVGALIAMQYYIKRGAMGRLRSSTDNIGEQYVAGYTTSKIITEQVTGKVDNTRETVGLKADGTPPGNNEWSTGITKAEVVESAQIHRHNETGQEEKITKTLSQEEIFDRDIK